MRSPPTAPSTGLASILPAAAAGSLALAAAVAATAQPARPDAAILDLVEAYFAAEAERLTIYADADAAFDRYIAPPVPQALLQQPSQGDGWWGLLGRALDVTMVDGVERPFYASEEDVPGLRREVERCRAQGVAPHIIERADAILAGLDAYMPEVERAKEKAGVALFHREADAVEDRKDELLRQIVTTPATTPDGLRAKAAAALDDIGPNPISWLVNDHIPALLAGTASATLFPNINLAAVFSLATDAARLGAPAAGRKAGQ